MVLTHPTNDIIRFYIAKFEEKDYVQTENAIIKLFQAFPFNRQIEDILLKVAAINNLYNTNIYAVYDMAKHIWKADLDGMLERKSLDAVERVGRAVLGGKPRFNYSFASKYCAFHIPHTYPIYDSYVEQLLWGYQKQDGFADFRRAEMQQYSRFVAVLEKFKQFYGLEGFYWRELDRFLWLYGMENFQN